MNNLSKPELLVPAGDMDCVRAGVQNGADAIYFGCNSFSARANAKNFSLNELKDAIEYCKLRNVKTNLTINTLLTDDEFEEAVLLAKSAYEYGIDAIIVQDFGFGKFLIDNFPNLDVHASTQMSVHNLEGALELEKLGFKRVVLARELSISEIEYIKNHSNIELEIFIHGALCISYSGQCLFSSLVGGRSRKSRKVCSTL
jgi:putative protease